MSAAVSIGNVTIQPVLDAGNVLMDVRAFFPRNGEDAIVEYPHLLDERGLMQVRIACFLVRSGGRTILVDTGVGPRRRPRFPVGHLGDNLREAGVDPADIDTVVHTHLHIDHVGWNTVDDGNGQPRIFFPNATFVIQQREWDYWMQPVHIEANDYLRDCVEPLRDSGRITFVDGEEPLDEALTFIATPGHTPGHVAIGIYSGGERAVLIGDVSHHPMQLDHPDWSPGADVDPVLSANTRARLMDDAAADGRTWIAGHWPDPAIGSIVRVEGKRVFQAL